MSESEYKKKEMPIVITPEQLSEEALSGIIENFILREGTDYGMVEVSYEKKAQQVRRQIEKGDIKIIFDQTSETVSLLTATAYRKLMSEYQPPTKI